MFSNCHYLSISSYETLKPVSLKFYNMRANMEKKMKIQ